MASTIHRASGRNSRSLPFKGSSCHVVFAAEVLSYIEEMDRVLREVHRVLKVGGVFVLTDCLVYPLRDTWVDTWRMTPLGLRALLRRLGFVVEKAVPLGGFWTTMSLLTNVYLFKDLFGFDRLLRPERPAVGRLLVCILTFPLLALWCALVNLLALGLDRFHRVDRFAYGYLIVARKA